MEIPDKDGYKILRKWERYQLICLSLATKKIGVLINPLCSSFFWCLGFMKVLCHRLGTSWSARFLIEAVKLHDQLFGCISRKLLIQASTLTQNDTGPVGPVTPSIYWSCKKVYWSYIVFFNITRKNIA